VLVNITATRSLKMKEVNEVMNTVRAFAADDAHIIFGAVYDEEMGEDIRVTVVATGLGQAQAKREKFEVISNSMAREPEPTAASRMVRTSTTRRSTRCRRSFARGAAQPSKRWPIAVSIATIFRPF
jgi:cell division GTPase FtsZ